MRDRTISFGLCSLVLVCLARAASSQCGTSFVEGFEALSNQGSWVWSGTFQASYLSGGNPDGWTLSEPLVHPAPRFQTTDPNSPFGGDWRARGVTSVGIDLFALHIAPEAQGRALALVLYHDNATPGVPGDDPFVYTIAGQIPGDDNWHSYNVDVDSASTVLPSGWAIGGPWSGTADDLWNLVVGDVERVAWVVGHPALAPEPASFRFGSDNARLGFAGGPTTYCIAQRNSLGCSPAMTWFGRPSATALQPFAILGTQLRNQSAGMLIYGQAADQTALFGAFRCVAPPLRRTLLGNTNGSLQGDDCSGALLIDFNAFIRAGTDPFLAPGATVYAQFWSRDALSVQGVSLTNALRFTICP